MRRNGRVGNILYAVKQRTMKQKTASTMCAILTRNPVSGILAVLKGNI